MTITVISNPRKYLLDLEARWDDLQEKEAGSLLTHQLQTIVDRINSFIRDTIDSITVVNNYSLIESGAAVQLVDAAIIQTDASLGKVFKVTFKGNRLLENPGSVPYDGRPIAWVISQDGTGSRTITLGSKFNLGALTVTLSTAANKRDYLGAIYNEAADKFDVVAFVTGY